MVFFSFSEKRHKLTVNCWKSYGETRAVKLLKMHSQDGLLLPSPTLRCLCRLEQEPYGKTDWSGSDLEGLR